MLEKVRETAQFLIDCGIKDVKTGIVLGTGLGNLVDQMTILKSIQYSELPNFPAATVEFHSGKLIFGLLGGKPILAMNGRFHYYEGHNLQEVTFPIRVMKLLGIENVLLSNACGSVNPAFEKSSIMIIDDHINMLPGNPLVGKNYSQFGPRILDMSQPYDLRLIEMMENIARREKITVYKGVYVAWMGPSLETRAEYRFIRLMGADVVGMSTVPEVIVANHMGMKVAAISVITDLCDPDHLQPLDMEDVLANAAKAEKNLTKIFMELVKEL